MRAPRSLFVLSVATALVAALPAQRRPQRPDPLEAPSAPVANPVTAEKAVLGKALFWDEQLSSDRSVACGTCHRWEAGGSDPRID